MGGKGSGRPGGNPLLLSHRYISEGDPKNQKLSVWVTARMKQACDERGKDWVRSAIQAALDLEETQ